MHDPMTVICEIPNPLWWRRDYQGRLRPAGLGTLWHVDPEKDGSDDSCGWFMRSRHGDRATLERIVGRFEHDWDRVFESENAVYCCGLFRPDGLPHFSVPGVVLNLFFLAACEVFKSDGRTNWKKARRWMGRNLFDILLFAENPTDSLHDAVTRKFERGCNEPNDERRRKERVRSMAHVVYGWILRSERPWYRHPRWHFWHWRVQLDPVIHLKRWLFSRCCKCGGRFRWGEAPISSNRDSDGPRWFGGERGVYHQVCEEGVPCRPCQVSKAD